MPNQGLVFGPYANVAAMIHRPMSAGSYVSRRNMKVKHFLILFSDVPTGLFSCVVVAYALCLGRDPMTEGKV